MFRDSFESPTKPQPRTLNPAEQIFWRIVGTSLELKQLAQTLATRGQFSAVQSQQASYMRYSFSWKGQTRQFDAQITTSTNHIQLKNFLTTCEKGLNGVFDRPNIQAYTRANRRPL